MNPSAQRSDDGIFSIFDPKIEASHLNTFTPVGTAIVIVADVK